MKIAFQGEPGAYSEAAALRFAPNTEVMPCRSFDEVFAAVQSGVASHGILPMENSIGGSIHRNYDRWSSTSCRSSARWSCTWIIACSPRRARGWRT
jgi:prephenate dehydratase